MSNQRSQLEVSLGNMWQENWRCPDRDWRFQPKIITWRYVTGEPKMSDRRSQQEIVTHRYVTGDLPCALCTNLNRYWHSVTIPEFNFLYMIQQQTRSFTTLLQANRSSLHSFLYRSIDHRLEFHWLCYRPIDHCLEFHWLCYMPIDHCLEFHWLLQVNWSLSGVQLTLLQANWSLPGVPLTLLQTNDHCLEFHWLFFKSIDHCPDVPLALLQARWSLSEIPLALSQLITAHRSTHFSTGQMINAWSFTCS